MLDYIIVADSHNRESALPHVFVSFAVIFRCMFVIVTAAVDFYDESQVLATEVREVWTDWALATKLAALKSAVPQVFP